MIRCIPVLAQIIIVYMPLKSAFLIIKTFLGFYIVFIKILFFHYPSFLKEPLLPRTPGMKVPLIAKFLKWGRG